MKLDHTGRWIWEELGVDMIKIHCMEFKKNKIKILSKITLNDN